MISRVATLRPYGIPMWRKNSLFSIIMEVNIVIIM